MICNRDYRVNLYYSMNFKYKPYKVGSLLQTNNYIREPVFHRTLYM